VRFRAHLPIMGAMRHNRFGLTVAFASPFVEDRSIDLPHPAACVRLLRSARQTSAGSPLRSIPVAPGKLPDLPARTP